jgi:hypothetical protein
MLFIDDDGPPLSNTDVKNLVILTELPFVVSFAERVKVRDTQNMYIHNFYYRNSACIIHIHI